MYNNRPLSIAIFILYSFITLDNIAQNSIIINSPLVREGSTTGNVYIKSITITSQETRIDFIACFTGNYIYLSPPYNKNSMYIKCNGSTYSLKKAIGIADKDGVTICKPNEIIEFSAIFYPFIDYKKVHEFDIIEGANGAWNFHSVSTDKHLASDLSLVYERAYWRGERNWDNYPYKSEWNSVSKTSKRKSESKKKLKKDPNFRID